MAEVVEFYTRWICLLNLCNPATNSTTTLIILKMPNSITANPEMNLSVYWVKVLFGNLVSWGISFQQIYNFVIHRVLHRHCYRGVGAQPPGRCICPIQIWTLFTVGIDTSISFAACIMRCRLVRSLPFNPIHYFYKCHDARTRRIVFE